MNFKNSLIIILFIAHLAIATDNDGIKFTSGTFEEVLAIAEDENKLIFMDCYTTWCGPCKWLAANVFTDPAVGAFFNENFINAKFDMEKGEGVDIAKRYNIRAYPTMLFLNGKGEMVHRICGSMPAEKLIEKGETALNSEENIQFYLSQYESGVRDADFMAEYLLTLQDACMEVTEADQYWSTQAPEDLMEPRNWKMIKSFTTDITSREFEYLVSNKADFQEKFGEEEVEQKIKTTIMRHLLTAVYRGTDEEFETAKEKVRESNHPEADIFILQAEMQKALNDSEIETYASLAEEYIEKEGTENSGAVNSIAWALYERSDNQEILSKAVSWMDDVVQKSPEYAYLDTYAALLYKTGNTEKAEKWAKKAIEAAKADDVNYEGTEELMEKYSGEI